MYRYPLAHALLAAAALFVAGPARALSTATSTLAEFRITLTDLDPSDGIAPSLTFDPASRSTALAGAVAPGANTFWMQQGDSAFGAVSTSGDLGGTGGSASFDGGDPLGAGATLVSHAVGAPSFQIGTAQTYIDTQPTGQNNFVLAPHTQVTFSGAGTVEWDASSTAAAAYGLIDLELLTYVGGSQNLVALDELTGGYYGDGSGPLSGSSADQVLVTYANDSDDAVLIGYAVDTFAGASELETSSVPVDEPAGAGLLLAGVVTLLHFSRRHRTHRPG